MTNSNINLTNTQKKVLSIIHTAPTPSAALAKASRGEKELAALDILSNIGVIDLSDEEATITDHGRSVMEWNGMFFDNDELTDEMKQLVTEQRLTLIQWLSATEKL